MSTHLTPSDRTFMKHFAILIAVLGTMAVGFAIIGTLVWASSPTYSREGEVQRAGARITPVAAVYAGKAGAAAAAAAAPVSSGPSPEEVAAANAAYKFDPAKGKSLYDGTCAACHQATGEGVAGAFPPLKGNPAVADADAKTQIETILNGRHGTVIQGKTYPGAMPPFGGQFSDLQIADIANYERSSWGNHGKPVSAKDVAAVRANGGK
ncbi:MAG TPA: cytochrome c [Rhodanobacteraceae bacterium]|nr:cytochrome c [Rhodanobacteraceae bacterium]